MYLDILSFNLGYSSLMASRTDMPVFCIRFPDLEGLLFHEAIISLEEIKDNVDIVNQGYSNLKNIKFYNWIIPSVAHELQHQCSSNTCWSPR